MAQTKKGRKEGRKKKLSLTWLSNFGQYLYSCLLSFTLILGHFTTLKRTMKHVSSLHFLQLSVSSLIITKRYRGKKVTHYQYCFSVRINCSPYINRRNGDNLKSCRNFHLSCKLGLTLSFILLYKFLKKYILKLTSNIKKHSLNLKKFNSSTLIFLIEQITIQL